MRTEMRHQEGEITASATDIKPVGTEFTPFTVLRFSQAGGGDFELWLPDKMSACASQIAGAFNAAMTHEEGESVREQIERLMVSPSPAVALALTVASMPVEPIGGIKPAGDNGHS